MVKLSHYDTAKLTKATRFNPPETIETEGFKFKVGKIQSDEDFVWSIDLKFDDYFQTFSTTYNLVIVKNFKGFEKKIDSLIEKLAPQQISIDDYTPKKTRDIFEEINNTIREWNQLNEVTNIVGTLKKYEHKAKAREMTFYITSSAVSWFKDEFNPTGEYLMFLEPTKLELQPEAHRTIAVPKVVYKGIDFIQTTILEKDFLK